MGSAVEYRKLMTEIVYINLPGPQEPEPGMSGGELLHGFLADLYEAANPDVRNFVRQLCEKWNIRYRGEKRHRYPVILEKAGNNFSAYLPDLPGCIATGATRKEVEKNIRSAIVLHIKGLADDGLSVPEPESSIEYVEA